MVKNLTSSNRGRVLNMVVVVIVVVTVVVDVVVVVVAVVIAVALIPARCNVRPRPEKTRVAVSVLQVYYDCSGVVGSGCGTVVEHMPRVRERHRYESCRVVGFFSSLLYPISSASLIRSLVEGQHV